VAPLFGCTFLKRNVIRKVQENVTQLSHARKYGASNIRRLLVMLEVDHEHVLCRGDSGLRVEHGITPKKSRRLNVLQGAALVEGFRQLLVECAGDDRDNLASIEIRIGALVQYGVSQLSLPQDGPQTSGNLRY
jgi:hypothetical protein